MRSQGNCQSIGRLLININRKNAAGPSKVVARILKGSYNWRGADAIQMEPHLG